MKRVLLIPVCLLLGVRLCAQADSTAQVLEEERVDEEEEIVEENDWVEYVGGFDFREGVYRTWREFRLNAPSIPLEAFRRSDGQPIEDFRRHEGRLFILNDSTKNLEVYRGPMWGFCSRNVVLVAAGIGYNRIGIMGSLCHLTYEFMTPTAESMGRSFISGVPQMGTMVAQALLNMETGELTGYDAAALRAAISGDGQLLAEFDALPKRKRNKPETLFQFLRHYNQRNPLRFPPS
ncbi:MAG: hypothetical protein IPJ76_11460 [Flavobacteriales bacterium]|nr:MAG: hypothetical protein IPJ76_11460 [Flavobacteriales bacterium]